MIPRDDNPRLLRGGGPERGRARVSAADPVGWATWTLCGTLMGLVVGTSLWHGRAAAGPETLTPPALPPAAAGVTVQPGTVWVALSSRTYFHADQAGFATAFPGVFMAKDQAVARGFWPAVEP
jgi:hypothetical protein